MATQWVTFCKIGGIIVEAVDALMSASSCNLYRGELTDSHERSEKQSFNDRLKKSDMRRVLSVVADNSARPPVLFYHKYIDAWSIAPLLMLRTHLQRRRWFGSFRLACTESDSMMFVRSNNWRQFARQLKSLVKKTRLDDEPTFEFRQFVQVLRMCALSWDRLLLSSSSESAIIIAIEPIGPSWTDEEVIADCLALPAWSKDLSSGEDTCGENSL